MEEKKRKTNDNFSPSPTPNPDSASTPSVVWSSRDQKPLHYTLQIQSFSLLKAALVSSYPQRDRYESQTFNADGYKWKLALYPNGDDKRNGSDHISLYLVMAEDDVLWTTTSEVNVVFTFLVYDNLRDKYLTVQDGKVRRFDAIKKEWGFEKLVSLDTFNDASNGLLVDDCCAFGVDVIVMKCDGGNGEVLSLIKQPKNYTYTWKFTNFSKQNLKRYESDPFTVESYRWKIYLICPRRDYSRSVIGLSALMLKLDSFKQLPQGFQVYVEYEMTVLSQLGVGHINRTYNHWFDGAENGWDTQDILSVRGLDEPTKGYLCDDTITVEVKINVISTLEKFS